MPPRKEKNVPVSTSVSTEPDLAPVGSGDQPSSPTASSDNAIASLRQEVRLMSVDLNMKLDTVISSQQRLINRIETLETKQTEMEEALQFSSKTIEEIQDKNKTMSAGVSNLSTQLNTALNKIKHLEEATLNLERHSRGFNLRFGGIPNNPTDCHNILRDAKEALTNTGIFILPDLPASDVAKERSLRDVMKRAYDSGQHPVFRNGELYIQVRKYTAPQAN